MSGYVTSACWQTETAKTTSHYAVRILEPAKPSQKKRSNRKPGRNSCSESAGSMSRPVPSVKKAECSGWRCCSLIDATAHRVIQMSIIRNDKLHSPASCEKSTLFRHALLLPKIAHSYPSRSSVGQSYTYVGARNWSVSVQTGQQGSLLTRLSMEKTEK